MTTIKKILTNDLWPIMAGLIVIFVLIGLGRMTMPWFFVSQSEMSEQSTEYSIIATQNATLRESNVELQNEIVALHGQLNKSESAMAQMQAEARSIDDSSYRQGLYVSCMMYSGMGEAGCFYWASDYPR